MVKVIMKGSLPEYVEGCIKDAENFNLPTFNLYC